MELVSSTLVYTCVYPQVYIPLEYTWVYPPSIHLSVSLSYTFECIP